MICLSYKITYKRIPKLFKLITKSVTFSSAIKNIFMQRERSHHFVWNHVFDIRQHQSYNFFNTIDFQLCIIFFLTIIFIVFF